MYGSLYGICISKLYNYNDFFFLRLHQYAHNMQISNKHTFPDTLWFYLYMLKTVFVLLLSCTALPVLCIYILYE